MSIRLHAKTKSWYTSKPSDWFKVNHVHKHHASFFLCLLEHETTILLELSSVCKKKCSTSYCLYKKQTHLIQNKWNRTLAHTVVGQNSRKAMMSRRRTLSVTKIHVSARRPLFRQHSLLLKKDTKKKPKKPTLGLKKFVPKVGNPIHFFLFLSWRRTQDN